MAEITSERLSHALTRLNQLPAAPVQATLLTCCAAPAWAAMMASGRPYASLDDLLKYSDAALATLTEDDIAQALAAHPRIGRRAEGSGHEAIWSRGEQSGASGASPAVRQLIAKGNATYERRFGRVFLICATGLTGEQLLTALRARLTNDDDTERAIVREELRRITRLRLLKLVRA